MNQSDTWQYLTRDNPRVTSAGLLHFGVSEIGRWRWQELLPQESRNRESTLCIRLWSQPLVTSATDGNHIGVSRITTWRVEMIHLQIHEMRDHDLIMVRWIKRIRGERSSCSWLESQRISEMWDRDLIVVRWIKRTCGERSSCRWLESQRNSRMWNHDLIKDRWIKRTHGERSERHKAPSRSFAYCDLEWRKSPS